MPGTSIIEIKPLTDLSNLCYGVLNYSRNTLSCEEICTLLKKHFILGYEVTVNGVPKGWSYSLLINGNYSLDGLNEGVSIFTAAKMGKMVCEDLFAGYADKIYSAHYNDELVLHILVKRIGFKKHAEYRNIIVFYKDKSWDLTL